MRDRSRSTTYKVGTKVRKKFNNTCYNGRVVKVDSFNKHYHVKYDDSDSESVSEGELKSCVELYNKYNK